MGNPEERKGGKRDWAALGWSLCWIPSSFQGSLFSMTLTGFQQPVPLMRVVIACSYYYIIATGFSVSCPLLVNGPFVKLQLCSFEHTICFLLRPSPIPSWTFMIYFYMFYIFLDIMARHIFFNVLSKCLFWYVGKLLIFVFLYPTSFLKALSSSESLSADSFLTHHNFYHNLLVRAVPGQAQIPGMEKWTPTRAVTTSLCR